MVARWLKALGLERWTRLRDPAACDGFPANEHERWRKIWNGVVELVERVKG